MKYTNLILWTGLFTFVANGSLLAAGAEPDDTSSARESKRAVKDLLTNPETHYSKDVRDGLYTAHDVSTDFSGLNLRRWIGDRSVVTGSAATKSRRDVPFAPKLGPVEADTSHIEELVL